MQNKPLPDIGQQNVRLATNNSQVLKQLDGLTARIDAPGTLRSGELAEHVHIDSVAPGNASAMKNGVSRLLSVLKGKRADATAGK